MKSGFVAILGRPNVGKSTLLNAILNKKVSIVTDKAQTTRDDIKGIYNSDDAQIVFIDTPGIHKPHQKLGQEMNNMAFGAAHNVDASILVIDSSKSFGDGDQYLLDHLEGANPGAGAAPGADDAGTAGASADDVVDADFSKKN